MSRHAISDQLLRTMVGIRLESGVAMTAIRGLVDEFACAEPDERHPRGTIGFLRVEDIASDFRATFLSSLAALAAQRPEPGRHTNGRDISANAIWG
jgi:hypothetical protein